MECHICCRGYDAKRQPFYCAVDARNHIYEGRMRNLQLIMENEDLQKQINDLLGDKSKPGKDGLEAAHACQRLTDDRTDRIIAAADRLREEIKTAREEVRKKRAALARRRSDLATVAEGLAQRREKQQTELESSAQMQQSRWLKNSEEMSQTRSFLCTEALRLYGLKRIRKGNSGPYDYSIGRVPIMDLVGMDSLSPEVLSTSLGHVAHILMLVAHYLAIRLPAEITLPHRNYPRPTIFTLPGSYSHGTVSFPATPTSTTVLSDTRGNNSQVGPRPRPLFISKPLQQLAKEDPAAYSFFLEGATLLAYDVAWLCYSQGVHIGEKGSFEDISNIGRNLYNLLLASQSFGTCNQYVNTPRRGTSEGTQGSEEASSIRIGRFSHGTMYYFLSGADGTELVKSFKLPSPMKLVDRLKKKLPGDAPAADWELLEDDAWKIEEGSNLAVLNEARETTQDDTKMINADQIARKGTGRWTKVKSRN